MLKRGGLRTGRGLAVDERQVDRAVRVGMGNGCADARVDDLKRDLLAAFARKRLAGRLAGFDLPADELPVPAQRLAHRPPTEEIAIPSADDTAYDFDDLFFRVHLINRSHYTIFPGACVDLLENSPGH